MTNCDDSMFDRKLNISRYKLLSIIHGRQTCGEAVPNETKWWHHPTGSLSRFNHAVSLRRRKTQTCDNSHLLFMFTFMYSFFFCCWFHLLEIVYNYRGLWYAFFFSGWYKNNLNNKEDTVILIIVLFTSENSGSINRCCIIVGFRFLYSRRTVSPPMTSDFHGGLAISMASGGGQFTTKR